MLFSGLKTQIATTLAVLLTLAILLGNIVVIAFWQKAVVRSELEHARSVWRSAQLSDNLQSLCSYTGKRCVGVVLSNGEHWLKRDFPELQAEIDNLAQESLASQTEITRLINNQWGFLSSKKRYLLVAEPLSTNGSKALTSAVVIIALDSIYESILENHQAIFVYWLVNVILLTVVGFFRMIALTVRPIERMIRMSESYSDSETLIFAGESNRSELGQLSLTLNGMLSRIETDREKLRQTVTSLEAANAALLKTQKEMIRTEKMASVGRLSAGLAHEIGNPIGIVQGYVELLQQADLAPLDKQEFGQRALSELDRIHKLIRQLLDYAGSSSHEISAVNVDEIFSGVCQIVALKMQQQAVSLSREIPADIFVAGDGESLRQVFLNCLLNGLDAIETNPKTLAGQIIIIAEKVIDAKSQQTNVHIRIEDNGTGIDKKDLAVIFDPFFTTKDPGKGTGLGLFVSHSIIDAHGGTIWIESTVGRGSIVHIMLPLSTDPAQEGSNESVDH